MRDWVDRHSVTCVCCGGLADERETVNIDVEQARMADPENTEFHDLIEQIQDRLGYGEAHRTCFEVVQDEGIDVIDDLQPVAHRGQP